MVPMKTVTAVIAGAALLMAAGGVAVAASLSDPEPPRIGDPVVIESPTVGPTDPAGTTTPRPTPGSSPAPTRRPGQGGADDGNGPEQVRPTPRQLESGDDDGDDRDNDDDDSTGGDDSGDDD